MSTKGNIQNRHRPTGCLRFAPGAILKGVTFTNSDGDRGEISQSAVEAINRHELPMQPPARDPHPWPDENRQHESNPLVNMGVAVLLALLWCAWAGLVGWMCKGVRK